jgi:hypothetical protein
MAVELVMTEKENVDSPKTSVLLYLAFVHGSEYSKK